MKEHVVCLTDEARSSLQELVRAGTRSVRVVRRVQTLLKSDEGLTDEEIAEHVGVTVRTIAKIRKRFCQEGWERAVFDAPRSGKPPVFTVKQQQQVIALACTDPPAGHGRWTLELLRQEAKARGFVSSISTSEVSLWLHEHDLKPWRKKAGASPSSRQNSGSAWKMC
jgi:transposase